MNRDESYSFLGICGFSTTKREIQEREQLQAAMSLHV